MHPALIPAANRQFRARDALARLMLPGSGATVEEMDTASEELDNANAHCRTTLKRFHTNRNRVIGGVRTPRGTRATAAHNASAASGPVGAMSLVELQNVRSLMEDGLGMLGSVSHV